MATEYYVLWVASKTSAWIVQQLIVISNLMHSCCAIHLRVGLFSGMLYIFCLILLCLPLPLYNRILWIMGCLQDYCMQCIALAAFMQSNPIEGIVLHCIYNALQGNVDLSIIAVPWPAGPLEAGERQCQRGRMPARSRLNVRLSFNIMVSYECQLISNDIQVGHMSRDRLPIFCQLKVSINLVD